MSTETAYIFKSAERQEEADACMTRVYQVMEDDSVTKYYAKQHKRFEFSCGLYASGYKALQRDVMMITVPENKGCALVLRQPAQQWTVLGKIWHGGWKPLVTCVPLSYWRSLLSLGDKLEKHHKEFTQEHGAHLYVWVIVAEPQGLGLGGRLLRALTDLADSEGLWCYLEATTSRSRDLYARHGFEQRDEWVVDAKELILYPMARSPRKMPNT
ncbi:hypothetical protein WJX73_002508 [Symbiochloris irregularis]|uniref:N-acetyltransferase domain-containing protein n=1 Tax=Symbiochloris irregularis TaxID=706552 RepID=A0AAW1PVJ2_9CHLO